MTSTVSAHSAVPLPRFGTWALSIKAYRRCAISSRAARAKSIFIIDSIEDIGTSVTGGAREVARDDHDPDMPLFFLSYARAPSVPHANGPQPDPNGYFVRFFNDLLRNIAELVPRVHGADLGFMDRTMQGGGRWTDELLQAVGGCQVFVPLLSAPYVRSEWCGMEWHAFSERTVGQISGGPSSHQTCIVPVNWAPVDDEHIPACVLAVQRFSPTDLPDPDMAHRYAADGIYGLLKMGLDNAYQTITWRLALRIRDIYRMHSVEPRTFDRAELCDIFQRQRDAQHLPGARQ